MCALRFKHELYYFKILVYKITRDRLFWFEWFMLKTHFCYIILGGMGLKSPGMLWLKNKTWGGLTVNNIDGSYHIWREIYESSEYNFNVKNIT